MLARARVPPAARPPPALALRLLAAPRRRLVFTPIIAQHATPPAAPVKHQHHRQQAPPPPRGGGWLEVPKGLRVMAAALQEVFSQLDGLHVSDLLLSLVVMLRVAQQPPAALAPAAAAVAAAAEDDAAADDAALRVTVDAAGTTHLPPGAAAVTDAGDLLVTARLLRWANVSYASHAGELAGQLEGMSGVDPATDVHLAQYAADPRTLLPAHVVGVDHVLRAVVVSIRGTWTWADALVNFAVAPEVFLGGTVHRGMLLTARQLTDHINLRVPLTSLLHAQPSSSSCDEHFFQRDQQQPQRLPQQPARPDRGPYRLILTGHSLGGGVAALAAALLRLQHPRVQAHAFSAPSCVSAGVAEALEPIVVSYAHGDDVVPRFHVDAAERLRRRLSAMTLYDELQALLLVDGVVGRHRAVAAIARALVTASGSLSAGASAVSGWTATLLRDAPLAALARLGATDLGALRKLVRLSQQQPLAAATAAATPAQPLTPPPPAGAAAATSTMPFASEVSASVRYLSHLLGPDSDGVLAAEAAAPAAPPGSASAAGAPTPAAAGAPPSMDNLTNSPDGCGYNKTENNNSATASAAPTLTVSTSSLTKAGGAITDIALNSTHSSQPTTSQRTPHHRKMETDYVAHNSAQKQNGIAEGGGSNGGITGTYVLQEQPQQPPSSSTAQQHQPRAAETSSWWVWGAASKLASYLPSAPLWGWGARGSTTVAAAAAAAAAGTAGGSAGVAPPLAAAASVDELAAELFLAAEEETSAAGKRRAAKPQPLAVSGGGATTASLPNSAATRREWVRGLQFYPPGRLLYLSYPVAAAPSAAAGASAAPAATAGPSPSAGSPEELVRARLVAPLTPQHQEALQARLQSAAAAAADADGDDASGDSSDGVNSEQAAVVCAALHHYVGPVLLALPRERPGHVALPAHVTLASAGAPLPASPPAAAATPASVPPAVVAALSSHRTHDAAAAAAAGALVPPALMDHRRYFTAFRLSPHMFADHWLTGLEAALYAWADHVAAVRLRRRHLAPLSAVAPAQQPHHHGHHHHKPHAGGGGCGTVPLGAPPGAALTASHVGACAAAGRHSIVDLLRHLPPPRPALLPRHLSLPLTHADDGLAAVLHRQHMRRGGFTASRRAHAVFVG